MLPRPPFRPRASYLLHMHLICQLAVQTFAPSHGPHLPRLALSTLRTAAPDAPLGRRPHNRHFDRSITPCVLWRLRSLLCPAAREPFLPSLFAPTADPCKHTTGPCLILTRCHHAQHNHPLMRTFDLCRPRTISTSSSTCARVESFSTASAQRATTTSKMQPTLSASFSSLFSTSTAAGLCTAVSAVASPGSSPADGQSRCMHVDLKPENLLFRSPAEDADIMIADFGLSRVMDDEKFRALTEVCGTPGVSPLSLAENGHRSPTPSAVYGA